MSQAPEQAQDCGSVHYEHNLRYTITVKIHNIAISHIQDIRQTGSVVFYMSFLHSSLLLPPDCPGGEECFAVDRRSGEIKTTERPLTPSKEYLLRVQVIDGRGRKGPPATVAILAGYRPPQFTNSTYSLNVPENTPVGQSWVTAMVRQPVIWRHYCSGVISKCVWMCVIYSAYQILCYCMLL